MLQALDPIFDANVGLDRSKPADVSAVEMIAKRVRQAARKKRRRWRMKLRKRRGWR